jgi:hypothetical protein
VVNIDSRTRDLVKKEYAKRVTSCAAAAAVLCCALLCRTVLLC